MNESSSLAAFLTLSGDFFLYQYATIAA